MKGRNPNWNKCVCSNPQCDNISKTLQKFAPEGHVWIGKMGFERKTGGKQDVFVESIKLHLSPHHFMDFNGRKYYVAKHHFPLKLLIDNRKHKRRYTTYLTKDDVLRMDPTQQNLFRNENKVSKIQLSLDLVTLVSEDYYVQAPCQPISEVISYIDDLQELSSYND